MLEKIKEILQNNASYDGEITADTTFEEIGLDSLDMMQIIMDIEDEFGISVADDAGLKTVGELMNYIEEQQKNA
ncbi:acyl carrier protein [Solibaculum mannosilyticum]|uniref:Acyl carrier protein n=1 Tax=Solibaculum mannosilyticum TaxID=2780922 RepID=A0A7I8CZB7_9FIRM|nr:acyl carrier protein [Solibaculum mannosilyticum]MCO7136181.1 acyl carrier protein [[Clostridium] leptum]BCI59756.1 acyl carrier protein [Solibaculum mannosilyticum]CZT56350.1 Acyl carrier protein [Eubacteriaceae bacterium CHKCI005]